MKLYFSPAASSFVIHAMLETASSPVEYVIVKLHRGEQHRPEFRAINPRGQVPVLDCDEGRLTQLVAIVAYLDARHPEHEFLPRETWARTKALETLAWMNNTVHPAFTRTLMPERFASDAQSQAEVRRSALVVFAEMIGELDAMADCARSEGRAGLAGDRPGPLDFYAALLWYWGTHAGVPPQHCSALRTHVAAVCAQPGVARAIARERLEFVF